MPRESSRGALVVLFSVVAIDLIGFGVVMPVLPFYAREYGADGLTLGALLTSYAAMQLVFAPLWGRLSDRIGRRPVMLITIAGTAASLALLGLSDSLVGLFVARLFGGVFAANVSVATAYVGDVTDESERTRWMGMIGASFAVGFLVGPAIGGLLSPVQTDAGLRFTLLGEWVGDWLTPFGYGLPMLFAAGLAAVNGMYALVVLKEPAAHTEREVVKNRRSAFANPVVRRLCSVYFLFSFAVTQLESVFAFYMLDRFGYGARDVAWILVGMAIVMGGIQGGGMRTLAPRFGEKPLLIAGIGLLVLGFVTIPLPTSVALLLLPLLLCAVGRAIAHPPMLSMVSMAGPDRDRGAIMGTFQASASAARVVGPLAAGALYDAAIGAPFILASALMAISAVLSTRLPQAGEASVEEPTVPLPE